MYKKSTLLLQQDSIKPWYFTQIGVVLQDVISVWIYKSREERASGTQHLGHEWNTKLLGSLENKRRLQEVTAKI